MTDRELLELLAENESLRKDAERYRWLIKNANEIYFIGASGHGVNLYLDTHHHSHDKIKADADKLVDAAMSNPIK